MIDAHVRAMHQFHDCGIHSGGFDLQLLPEFLTFLGRQLERGIRLFRPGKLTLKELGQIERDGEIVASFCFDFEKRAASMRRLESQIL